MSEHTLSFRDVMLLHLLDRLLAGGVVLTDELAPAPLDDDLAELRLQLEAAEPAS